MSAGQRALRVVCLTPVKNEAWILREFLTAAARWADDIIIADQGSTDDSRAIAAAHPRVRLIENSNGVYDECARQQLLLTAARQIPGPRLLTPLDADEFLTPGLITEQSIAGLIARGPGACIRVAHFNVRPGLQRGWVGHRNAIAAWYDDGSPHRADLIHSRRLPVSAAAMQAGEARAGAVWHWQYVAPKRMRAKHRWYAAWERVHRPERHALDIYRQYHHMQSVSRRDEALVDPDVLSWHRSHGIDLQKIRDDGLHWWNRQVLHWLDEHGPEFFRSSAIWDHNWTAEAAQVGLASPERFADPRTLGQKLFHRWLRVSQRFHRSVPVRAVDKVLRHIHAP